MFNLAQFAAGLVAGLLAWLMLAIVVHHIRRALKQRRDRWRVAGEDLKAGAVCRIGSDGKVYVSGGERPQGEL